MLQKKFWTKGLMALALAILAGAVADRASGQVGGGSVPGVQSAEPELWWPLPASAQAYKVIDGRHVEDYVKEIVALTEKDRNGKQYWGRIAGTQSSEDAQDWVESKFRQIGLTVQKQEFPLPPQWMPSSWSVSASGGGKTIELGSVWPYLHSPGTPAGGVDLDAVWVGLGSAADFASKDVRGKAVVIYGAPEPTALFTSAMEFGSMKRAEDLGAAAVLVVLALPGNSQAAAMGGTTGGAAPVLTMGNDDGTALRELIEQASPGQPVRVHVQLDAKMVPGLKSWNLTGILPGQTDENILVTAHTDSYFDGADDNASGVAAMVALAEYYAKLPKEKRRRTMYFVATPDHHGGMSGAKWERDHMQSFFAKTALMLQCEHDAMTFWEWESPTKGSALTLPNTNGFYPEWWYVSGSDRMRSMFVSDLALFGVITHIQQRDTSGGDIICYHLDAPTADLIQDPTFFHTSLDVPGTVVPASGLERVSRAFAKFIDDVNTLSLREALPPTPIAAWENVTRVKEQCDGQLN